MYKNVQKSRVKAIQQSELVNQLQAKEILTESMVIDITVFQDQELEVCKKLEST
jgi:hypothetical protein